MQAIKNYKSPALAGILALGLAAVGLVYAQLSDRNEISGAASNSRQTRSRQASHGPGLKMLSMDKESRRRGFESWANLDAQAFPTPADAASALTFKLKYPKLESLGRPSGIYVDKHPNKDERTAHIFYGDPVDGINIEANKFKTIDFGLWAGEAEKNKKADILKANNTPFLIQVNGYHGWAWEPGYNSLNGSKEPKPGFVEWQESDGVVYTVSGTYGPDGTSVKELLEIARSMSE